MSDIAKAVVKRLLLRSSVMDVPLRAVVEDTVACFTDVLGGEHTPFDEVMEQTMAHVFESDWLLTEDGGLYPEGDVVEGDDGVRLHKRDVDRMSESASP